MPRPVPPLGVWPFLAAVTGCGLDESATVSYAGSGSYPKEFLAVSLGDQRLAGKEFETLSDRSSLGIETLVPGGRTAAVVISLVSGLDTLGVLRSEIPVRKGQRLTLQIWAGALPATLGSACATRIGPVPIRGGPATDSLAARWYQSDPTDFVGPC